MFLSAGNCQFECSRSCREINQHPNLLSNFIAHELLNLSASVPRYALQNEGVAPEFSRDIMDARAFGHGWPRPTACSSKVSIGCTLTGV